jgi:peptide/nickel transport system permease protein
MSLFRATFRSRLTRICGITLVVIAVVAVFANLVAPTNPYQQDITHLLAPPSWHHLLGTDYLGRDTLSRIILGTRISLIGALEAVGIGATVGVVPGILSVFLGRWPQFLVLRITDTFMTLPPIVFTIGVVAVFGNTQAIAMAGIGLLFSPHFFRVTRAATLGFGNTQYVEAAQLFGMTRRRIILQHVWRKVLPTVAVTIASSIAAGILIVSSLSFLGVGAQPPMPTWGGMLSEDMNYLAQNSYEAIFPGLAIVITVFALGIVADGLRDATGALSELDAVGAGLSLPGREPDVVRVAEVASEDERAEELEVVS